MNATNISVVFYWIFQILIFLLKVFGFLDWDWFWVFFPVVLVLVIAGIFGLAAFTLAMKQKKVNKSNRR